MSGVRQGIRSAAPDGNPRRLVHQGLGPRGHRLMHDGEEGRVVKSFNEKGDSPGTYRRVSHPVVVFSPRLC